MVVYPESLQKHCFVGYAFKPIPLCCRRTFLQQNNDECACNSRRLSRGADAKGDFPPYASDVGIVNSFFRRRGSSFSRRALNYGGGAMRCRNVGPFGMSRNADQIAISRRASRCEHVVGCDWLSAGSDHCALRCAMQAASAQKENRQVSDSYRPSSSDMYHGQ